MNEHDTNTNNHDYLKGEGGSRLSAQLDLAGQEVDTNTRQIITVAPLPKDLLSVTATSGEGSDRVTIVVISSSLDVDGLFAAHCEAVFEKDGSK